MMLSDRIDARDYCNVSNKGYFSTTTSSGPKQQFTSQDRYVPAARGENGLANDEHDLSHIAETDLDSPQLWTTAQGLARAVRDGTEAELLRDPDTDGYAVRAYAANLPGVPDDAAKLTGLDQMLANTRLFYCWLYRQRRVNIACQNRVINSFPVADALSAEATDELGAPVTVVEIIVAIRGLNSGKSPGPDGIIAEIYKAEPELWAQLLVHSYNAAFDLGRLSEQQRRGIICTLYKAKSPTDLANFRPVTLTQRATSVLSLVLTNRISPHLAALAMSDQTGFVPGRYMFENIRRCMDAVDFARERDLDLTMIATDFKKAFDQVDRRYMFRLMNRMCGVVHDCDDICVGELEALGIDPATASPDQCTRVHGEVVNGGGRPPDAGFVRWVKTLYNGHTRNVMVNGYLTGEVSLHSGVPQGDCLASSCFACAVETLGRMLRDAGVRGLVADTGETLAFCRFADDLELIVHPDDIGLALDTLDIFCAGTGMALNRSKCEGLWIGRRHDSTARPVMAAPGSPHSLVSASAEPLNLPAAEAERRQAADARRLPWLPPGSSVRVLGVQVGPDADGRDEWRGIANSMMTAMRRWTRTPLTYRARVAILKTLCGQGLHSWRCTGRRRTGCSTRCAVHRSTSCTRAAFRCGRPLTARPVCSKWLTASTRTTSPSPLRPVG